MRRYFLDSSALFKRYLEEDGTERVLEIMRQNNELIVSRLTMVEVFSAGARLARAGDISQELLSDLFSAVENDFREEFTVVELGGAAMVRSMDLVRAHGLRAADAIQLACAVMVAGESSTSSEFTFVCSDNELNSAAEKEGMTVLDPQRS